MIVQIYKNIKNNKILLFNKSHIFDKKEYDGYELLEEIEGEDWYECNKKITEKYFNFNSSET
jgi:hypothetical protein